MKKYQLNIYAEFCWGSGRYEISFHPLWWMFRMFTTTFDNVSDHSDNVTGTNYCNSRTLHFGPFSAHAAAWGERVRPQPPRRGL